LAIHFRALIERSLLIVSCISFSACHHSAQWSAPGNTEWDRAAVLAEISEPIVDLKVSEGQRVQAGELLMQLDTRRTDAQLRAAQADVERFQAQLLELRHGARQETIDSARAELARAESSEENAQREYRRAISLRKTNMISQQDRDRAETAASTAAATVKAQRAQLQELLHGTRPEQLAQAEAALAAAQANAEHLRVTRDRLDVRAPRTGRIDALPYRAGDQPPVGATLVSMLVGDAPYARIFIPEKYRAPLKNGAQFDVYIDGIDKPLTGILRSVRSDTTFTPYYALSGDDASRMSYRAELVLQGDGVAQLPPGIPCRAEPRVSAKKNN
jgi:HlyD family secretion protein